MLEIDYSTNAPERTIKVSAAGRMYAEQAADFRRLMLEKLDAGLIYIELDLSRLTYMDSAGLGVLISLNKKVAGVDGSLRLTGLTGEIKNLFELTRLHQVFEIR
ncbi:anti-sigma factor antagonist [Paenibacillus sambharensis]|uniref:Anti-sigma factor antagonist n=1 Tax=Paenibacillus sambharensis TaxID=1803190 RepID=A0A2W1LI02_9BACL|nr:STAS domain-containing protein [Paenibacillus sambharensis]PZD97640.1 anti-sigma factor antagonist [Paenibacillus sambharensis]